MSGVVLRCSNCGTVQASTGECEACHEAQVRYFCTNHTPGLWVDKPACPRCGARFGEAAPVATATRPAAPERPRRASVTRLPAPELDETPGPWDTMLSRTPEGEFRRPGAGILLEALAHAARARSMRKARFDHASDAPARRPGGGCVRRLLLLSLLLAVLFLFAPLLIGGALLQML